MHKIDWTVVDARVERGLTLEWPDVVALYEMAKDSVTPSQPPPMPDGFITIEAAYVEGIRAELTMLRNSNDAFRAEVERLRAQQMTVIPGAYPGEPLTAVGPREGTPQPSVGAASDPSAPDPPLPSADFPVAPAGEPIPDGGA
jgi:hypothetical protein